MEFPGFYFDPRTRKLFRIPKDGQIPQHVNPEGENDDIANISSIISPKTKNVLGLLRSRELGGRINPNIESPLLKLKTDIKFGTGEDLTEKWDEQISNILIVKGGQKSIFGMWEVRNSYEEVIREVFLDSEDLDPNVRFGRAMSVGIQDFCDGFGDSELLMIVSNCYRPSLSGRVTIFCRRREAESVEPLRLHLKRSPVFSCCSNSFNRQFAVGCEHSVAIENSLGSLYNIDIQTGNVHSVQYSERGEVLYCGVNSGELSVVDMRDHTFCFTLNLFNTGINELLLLSKEQYVLCGSFEGDLVKVDLRMRSTVAEFFNHSHSTKKSPISVNENLNLLCATGLDNITRLWSLDGGIPVQTIRPPNRAGAHKSWLLNDPWNATLHLFQNNYMYKYKI